MLKIVFYSILLQIKLLSLIKISTVSFKCYKKLKINAFVLFLC